MQIAVTWLHGDSRAPTCQQSASIVNIVFSLQYNPPGFTLRNSFTKVGARKSQTDFKLVATVIFKFDTGYWYPQIEISLNLIGRIMLVGESQQAQAWTEELQADNIIHPTDTHPISNLPPELFAQILIELHVLYQTGKSDYRDHDWTNPYRLVCRHWRDFICSTPPLWKEISVSRRPEWLEVCLARCAGTPAAVYVLGEHPPPATFATLRRHASSIKAIHVFSHLGLLSAVSSLLAAPMPVLEILSLRHSPFDSHAHIPIVRDLLPRLVTLSLTNWLAPRDIMAYAPLRSLTLTNASWPFSYDHFLEVMANAHSLEYLELNLDDLELPDMPADIMARHSLRKLPVVLPRVKIVKLEAPLELVFGLFASIYAPQAVTIEVGSYVHGVDEDPGPVAARLLAPLLQLGYPFLRSPNSILIRCRDGMLGLRLKSAAGSLFFFIEHHVLMYGRWPTARLAQNLSALMDVFSVAAVDALEVEGRPDRVAASTWKRVFQGFPRLRTLHVAGRGILDSLWLGLERATTASVQQGGAVCCPFLAEVTTDDRPHTFEFYASTRLFGVVREALGARAEHCGGRGLQKLKLHLWPAKELHNVSAERHDALVGDLRALVGELDYREHRRR